MAHCPALVVSAPASGQGKTSVTAALAFWHRRQGRRVRIFKTGPDFLDPMILEHASGSPVYSLDLWMVGEEACRRLLVQAAEEADLILIEGVMGLFDGDPSTADLACVFGIPVLAVIDATAMAQTFGALVHGLKTYQPDLPFYGVFANRIVGETHRQMLVDSLPEGVPFVGALSGQEKGVLPGRHLGLVQAAEIEDLDQRLSILADHLYFTDGCSLPPVIHFNPFLSQVSDRRLADVRIAVACDQAFSFLYPANLDLLRDQGAELIFFSPLEDQVLPQCDSLYLPGGYPELFLAELAANTSMKVSIRAHHQQTKPIVAECGGMLYLYESLTDQAGNRHGMIGLLRGHAVMQRRLTALALQEVEFPQGRLRGHTYHHSLLKTDLAATFLGVAPKGTTQEAVYQVGRLTASYIHFYFGSAPAVTEMLFSPHYSSSR